MEGKEALFDQNQSGDNTGFIFFFAVYTGIPGVIRRKSLGLTAKARKPGCRG